MTTDQSKQIFTSINNNYFGDNPYVPEMNVEELEACYDDQMQDRISKKAKDQLIENEEDANNQSDFTN